MLNSALRSRKVCQCISPEAADQIDSTLIKCVDLHHDTYGDYRQAVLIDGCSDRPFRLEWPKGTVVFMIGSTQQLVEHASSFPVRSILFHPGMWLPYLFVIVVMQGTRIVMCIALLVRFPRFH